MVLKRAKCDLMALKLLFLPQNRKNRPAAGGSALSVTCLSSNGLFSTRPKLDSFCAKNIPFGSRPLSLRKTLLALLIAFTPADIFFKRLYQPHAKRANKRYRAYMYLFFKDEYKIVALKYQLLCAKIQSIL